MIDSKAISGALTREFYDIFEKCENEDEVMDILTEAINGAKQLRAKTIKAEEEAKRKAGETRLKKLESDIITKMTHLFNDYAEMRYQMSGNDFYAELKFDEDDIRESLELVFDTIDAVEDVFDKTDIFSSTENITPSAEIKDYFNCVKSFFKKYDI